MRDCHAEVLARRGLLRFFLSEIKEFFLRYESSCNEKLYAGNESRGCGGKENLNKVEGHSRDTVSEMSRAEEQCKKIDACDTYQRILQVDQQTCKSSATSRTLNISISPLSTPITAQLAHPTAFNPSIFTLNSSTGLLSLKDGISLHMYSSSQPCGNATIKRWARAKKAQRFFSSLLLCSLFFFFLLFVSLFFSVFFFFLFCRVLFSHLFCFPLLFLLLCFLFFS